MKIAFIGTHGVGKTSSQPAYEGNINNGGLNYSMNGLASPATVSFPGVDPSNFAGVTTGSLLFAIVSSCSR